MNVTAVDAASQNKTAYPQHGHGRVGSTNYEKQERKRRAAVQPVPEGLVARVRECFQEKRGVVSIRCADTIAGLYRQATYRVRAYDGDWHRAHQVAVAQLTSWEDDLRAAGQGGGG